MKMTAVNDRRLELLSRRFTPGWTIAEESEHRDCEITLGFYDVPERTRAEAARRVEQLAEARARATHDAT